MKRWTSVVLAIVQACLLEYTECFVSQRTHTCRIPFLNRQQRPVERETKANLRNSATNTDGDGHATNGGPNNPWPGEDPNMTTYSPSTATAATTSHVQSHHPAANDDEIAGATLGLGDIMSVGLQMTAHNGDADSTTGASLAEQYGITHPLDRMALTANGNLQRLVSSYYDAPVSVVVDSCVLRNDETNDSGKNGAVTSITTTSATSSSTSSSTSLLLSNSQTTWDRTVHLTVFGQTFCTAKSVITVHDALCQQLVQSGQVGLGQLFRYLDLLPEFTLSGAGIIDENDAASGVGDGGGFWRDYTLSCAELTCEIHEDFRPGLWELKPLARNEKIL